MTSSLPVRLASGGTLATAALFLVTGIGSVAVRNGIFSAGIGAMLLVYAVLVAGIGWACLRRLPLADGAVVAAALLHLLVGVSTARGSGQGWLWLFVLLAGATLAAGVKAHVDDLRHPGV
ncbi:hypothetical protein GCM10009599_28480 [Luteococcus peritonei]